MASPLARWRAFADAHNLLALVVAAPARSSASSALAVAAARAGLRFVRESAAGAAAVRDAGIPLARAALLVEHGPDDPAEVFVDGVRAAGMPVIAVGPAAPALASSPPRALSLPEVATTDALAPLLLGTERGGVAVEHGSVVFGHVVIAAAQVFYATASTVAFVNIKPVLPGHVLIVPRRRCPRFTELTREEVMDLWTTAQVVGQRLERHYSASSLTLAIQDGPDAGQSVAHVHVHCIPRCRLDVGEDSDAVYGLMEEASHVMREGLEGSAAASAGGVSAAISLDPLRPRNEGAVLVAPGDGAASPISDALTRGAAVGELASEEALAPSRRPPHAAILRTAAEMAEEAMIYRVLFADVQEPRLLEI